MRLTVDDSNRITCKNRVRRKSSQKGNEAETKTNGKKFTDCVSHFVANANSERCCGRWKSKARKRFVSFIVFCVLSSKQCCRKSINSNSNSILFNAKSFLIPIMQIQPRWRRNQPTTSSNRISEQRIAINDVKQHNCNIMGLVCVCVCVVLFPFPILWKFCKLLVFYNNILCVCKLHFIQLENENIRGKVGK